MRVVMRLEAAGNRLGDSVRRLPGPGRWLGGVTIAVTSLAAGVVASTRGLATTPRRLPAGAAGAVLVVLGKLVALGQAVVGVPRGDRALDADELAMLERVFRGSVDLRAVRVVPGPAGVFTRTGRPFALGATVYLGTRLDPATLVHECVHVWQYQHRGCRYTAEALWAQHTVKPSAYRWTDELDRGRRHWREFNLEAQAQLLEDIARSGLEFFGDEDGSRFTHAGADHTDLARAAVAELRERAVRGPAVGTG
ncbi:hypothetical protein [Actinophytocola xanthii]|nr:hypothetical protein [Actinophytocola xanthii]